MASSPSPSPSSPVFKFPKQEQPNAHPYAIKTTSTALLSRSNSSSSHASVGPHHYVPSSPSPTANQHSPVKPHKPSRHRYSRSLTSDSPTPLPPPPVSPSPTFPNDDDTDDHTPRRRISRAETLPASVGAPAETLDLPEDPKSWTPSHLSVYLSSTLRAGNANIPAPVAKDIATFVRERRITGRVFLRLSEDDLMQFGINQLWRNTLLNSSRSLRQSILRGRIWGFGNSPPQQADDQEDNDSGNLSSSSSNVSSNGISAVHIRSRSRHSSSASSTSERNRVKDMVDSLEKSAAGEEAAAPDYDAGRRSISPHKTSKPRLLPQRGDVTALFGGKTGNQSPEQEPTVTARRTDNGREPRLLPFPPNQGVVYPLPLSPEHTGVSDYEMGYRSPTRSPHSQLYMVQHNPGAKAELELLASGKRPLPYPPMIGEARLHHPQPRRMVGSNEFRSDDEETGTSTDGYKTALEASSDGDTQEEPTMEDLLASQLTGTKVVSGAEAWEMELGDTVKRVGGDMSSNVNGKRGSSVAEIGRKAGRSSTGLGTKRDVDRSTKRSSLIGLFGPSEDSVAKEVVQAVDDQAPTQEGSHILAKKLDDLKIRETLVSERESNATLRERLICEREESLVAQKVGLQEQECISEKLWTSRKATLGDQDTELVEREQALLAREKAVSLKEQEMDRKQSDIARREQDCKQCADDLQRRSAELAEEEQRVRAKEATLDQLTQETLRNGGTWFTPVDILKKCWNTFLLPIVGEGRTPSFLNTSDLSGHEAATTRDSSERPHRQSTWDIKRDMILGGKGTSYVVLMSIGICVIALKALGKRDGRILR